ncbi:MAG TPA: hypothetical protein VGK30_03770 [Candidatus Binatia bacterium]|jgi:hypothetical protein
MSNLLRILVSSALLLGATSALAAEPAFTITDDGTAFVYKAKPGDQPGTVAEMFGIPQRDVPAFLSANGITDPTRVGVGHVYRIPNPVAVRASEAEAKAQTLQRDATALQTRADQLAHDLDAARTTQASAEQRAAGLARYERLWPLVTLVGMLLLLALGVLGWIAFTALQKTGVAEERARSLASEVEEKRSAGLAERQQSARRILDFESRVRDLELQLSRPLAARRSPASNG